MKRNQAIFLSVALTFLSTTPSLTALERIKIGPVMVDPQTPEAKKTIDDLVEKLIAVSNRLNGNSFEISGAASAHADYGLTLVASLTKDSPAVVIDLKRPKDDAQSPSYSWLGMPTPELPSLLARAVYLLWKSFAGYPARGSVEPPRYVDELPAAFVSPYAYPYSLAAEKGGKIAAAFINTCAEFDHTFAVVGEPGKSLAEGGAVSYAMGVSATPGGTLILKPAQGTSFYRIDPDGAAPKKVAAGLELTTAVFQALPDGSILLVDSIARKAFRLRDRAKINLPLFTGPSDYIYCMGIGPDGAIWIYDFMLKAFRVYSPEGRLVDYQMPLVDPNAPLSPVSMTIQADGGFIILSNSQLLKFNRDGSLVWRLESMDGAEVETLPSAGSVAFDADHGLIFVADTTGRRIVKLVDLAYCREKGIKNELEEKILALRDQGKLDQGSGLASAAALYQSAGSSLMAKAYWTKVQEIEPDDPAAEAGLRAIELAALRRDAKDLDAKARDTLRTIGMETARQTYAQAVQKYELILSKDPSDEASRKAMADLRALFSETPAGGEKRMPITIPEVKIANLFPSLMPYYSTHSAGTVLVKNPLTQAVERVRASLIIPRYMSFPSEAASLDKIPAGGSAGFDFPLTLDRSILELQEDMTVQARVDVSYSVGGSEQTVSRAVSVTIYRNSALTWDDTRKIASFITPNEETVSGFAHRALADAGGATSQYRVSPRLFQAIRVCDALGAYGIEYTPDPDAPIAKALGKTDLLDTVRFPRTTLAYRGGDCDDSTALLSSLLESIGVRTAILTTPGHIFLAFDSGEPSENAQFLSSKSLETISTDGETWIPVETTVLSKGFMAAWTEASALVRKYRESGPFEFIPLSKMREAYAALPLPASSITIVEPGKSAVDGMYSGSLSAFQASLYTARLAELDSQLKGLTGRQAGKVLVQEGVVNALFGRLAEAEAAFSSAMAKDPALLSPYLNLSNIKLLRGDREGALAAVNMGLSKNAGSALLNLLAARICAEKGDAAGAARYFAKVKSVDPNLAARNADVVTSSGAAMAATSGNTSTQRGAQAAAAAPVIWGGGD